MPLYRELDPTNQCQHCLSHDVQGHLEDNGDEVHREMSCNNCYAEWELSYCICGHESITIPINPIPDPDRNVVYLRTTSYLPASPGGV
ncbi:hypothetical protein KAR91_72045 [Candidatus Pacearchaeota archaeon]|nr:hypothetical protein [Candidatus Pacearchaeota archaeon]